LAQGAQLFAADRELEEEAAGVIHAVSARRTLRVTAGSRTSGHVGADRRHHLVALAEHRFGLVGREDRIDLLRRAAQVGELTVADLVDDRLNFGAVGRAEVVERCGLGIVARLLHLSTHLG